MARVDIEDLKNINSVDRLAEIFTSQLNYNYELTPISTRHWKESVAGSIFDKDIKLLVRHEDFHIVYCRIENLLLGTERPIVNQLLKEHPYLLVIFSDKSYQNWHFVNIKYDEEVKNRRLFRRIVIGPDERLHTAAERINRLEISDDKIGSLEVQNRHDIAFDVEEVTREFFDKFTDIFHLLSEDIEEENLACKGDCEAQAQLILNRLMFLYFIQKKGCLNNNPKYLYENFLTYWKKDPEANTFYSQFLIKLCQGLSSQTPLFKELLGDVPFLNGGLFEIDPFTSKLPFKLHIKNTTFKKIFDELLEKFNFTVREDTPLDVEVAIDPEMLGKVFENLILKLEKGEDLRRKTGSYYTPRVIVHFMCQESLKEYLVSESEIEKSKIESLFTLNPADQLTDEELQYLKKSIATPQAKLLKSIIKKAYILDPAVGSGAFLVGMLHEMISVIKLLDIVEFGQDHIQRPNYDYGLKRQLIESSLYGVDIQEQAVRICELRLWLSLIVDYEKVKGEKVPPLPNLSYKIKRGDSLIEHLFGYRLETDTLFYREASDLLEKIQSKKHDYFKEENLDRKMRIEAEIMLLQCELADRMLKSNRESYAEQKYLFAMTEKEREQQGSIKKQKQEIDALISQVNNIKKKLDFLIKKKRNIEYDDIHKLYPSERISFVYNLEFAEVFKEKGGFDIVVTNPPYLKERDSKEIFNRVIYSDFGKRYHQGKMDYWFYFLHKAIDVTSKDAIVCFITSRYWLNSAGATKLIERVKNELSFVTFVDIGKLKVFDDVAGQHMVAVYVHNKKIDDFLYKRLENNIDDINELSDTENLKIKILSNKTVITKNVEIIIDSEQLAMSNVINLGEICDISQGVVEAPDKLSKKLLNELKRCDLEPGMGVFVLSKSELAALNLNAKEKEIIKKYLDPSDIFRYGIERENVKYLIYSDKTIKAKIASDKNFINLRKHFDNLKEFITSSNAPYGLHRPRDQKYFVNPKILFKNMFVNNEFAYDKDEHYVGFSFSLIIQNDKQFDLKYILSILNSKFAQFWFYRNGKKRGAGVDIGVEKLRTFPIKRISNMLQKSFIDLVDEITDITKENDYLQNLSKQKAVQNLEHQIDQKVYELYGFSEEEIALVEKSK